MTDDISLSDLYGLPLDDFTAQRNVLARRLREAGDTAEARRVAALRKPTTDAWAVNQVVRSRPALIDALVATHEAIRAARDMDAARAASLERRRLIDETLAEALAVLDEAGHSASGTVQERISLTLLAAAGDREAEDRLRSGTLERPLEVSGEWPAMGLVSTARSAGDPVREEELMRLEKEAQELAVEAADARGKAEEARDALAEARRRSQDADQRARQAEKRARDAEAALRAARASS